MRKHVHQGFAFYSEHYANPTAKTNIVWIGGAMMPVKSMRTYNEWFATWSNFIGIDLPGTGDSDFLPSEYGPEFLADCIATMMDYYDLKKISLCASSYGGPAAIAFCIKYPERVEGLVAMATAHRLVEGLAPIFQAIVDAACKGDIETMTELFISRVFNTERADVIPRSEIMQKALSRALGRCTQRELNAFAANTKRLMLHDLELPPEINVPAIFFTGEYDAFTTPAMMAEIADHFKFSNFLLINDADHMLHSEQGPVIKEIMKDFLSSGKIRPHWPGQAWANTRPIFH